jgi:hypothetical protein
MYGFAGLVKMDRRKPFDCLSPSRHLHADAARPPIFRIEKRVWIGQTGGNGDTRKTGPTCQNAASYEANDMKNALIAAMVLVLAGCGGSNRFENSGRSNARAPAPVYSPTASGPLKNACLASNRKARSSQLCGCIQAVADQSLSRSDQLRAAKFYDDPQAAQDTRQSSRASDERFWDTYSDYSKQAARVCS